MNYEIVLSSDDEESNEILSFPGSGSAAVFPLRKLQIQEPFTNKKGLQALESYRRDHSAVLSKIAITNVRSLAPKIANTQTVWENKVPKINSIASISQGRTSSIKSIEDSIEACVQKYRCSDSPEVLPEECVVNEINGQESQSHSECSNQAATANTAMIGRVATSAPAPRNSVLFSEFVGKCAALEINAHDRQKAENKLRNYHGKARHDFVESNQFADIITEQMTKLNRDNLYVCIRDVLDILKLNKQTRRIPLQSFPSPSAGGQDHEDQARSTGQSSDGLLKIDAAKVKDRQKVIKLQNAMEALKKKIKILEDAEVDLDNEEDSAYLRMQRYRERFSKIYGELSNLTDIPRYAYRASKRKIRFSGTKYPKVNLLIERWLKKNNCFPDYADILERLKENDDLGLPLIHLQNIAQDAFQAIGDHLQRQRKRELWDILGEEYATDADPAANDPVLAAKLDDNQRLFREQELKIFKEFAEKQDAKQENPNAQDSEPGEESESEDDDTANDECSDAFKELDRSDIENVDTDAKTKATGSLAPAKRMCISSSDEPKNANQRESQAATDVSHDKIVDKNYSVVELNFFLISNCFPSWLPVRGSCERYWLKNDRLFNEKRKVTLKPKIKWEKKRKGKRTCLKVIGGVDMARQLSNYFNNWKLHGQVDNEGSSPTSSDNGEGSPPPPPPPSPPSRTSDDNVKGTSPPADGDEDDNDDKRKKNQNSNVEKTKLEVDEDESDEEENQEEIKKTDDPSLPSIEKESMLVSAEIPAQKQESDEPQGVRESCNSKGTEIPGSKDEKEPRQLRVRNASSSKPKWIDNGEESDETSEESEERDSSHDDPDFSLDSSESTKKKSAISSISKAESWLNGSDSKTKGQPENGEELETSSKPSQKVVEMVSVAPRQQTVSEERQVDFDDCDDIVVISENIVKRPDNITPQDRVNSFLANASKLAITVTRKRPMSRETKEALTQLKKLKNINISSSRLEKPEIMVLQDGSQGESSGMSMPRRRHSSSAVAASPTAPNCRKLAYTPNRPRLPAPASVRTARLALPVISSIQSFRNATPRITGVRGTRAPAGRFVSRGRAILRMNTRPTFVRLPPPPAIRGMRGTSRASTRSRGQSSSSSSQQDREISRSAPTSVPFVFLD